MILKYELFIQSIPLVLLRMEDKKVLFSCPIDGDHESVAVVG